MTDRPYHLREAVTGKTWVVSHPTRGEVGSITRADMFTWSVVVYGANRKYHIRTDQDGAALDLLEITSRRRGPRC